MPISIWNDHAYDENSIFTGSASTVNGQTVLVYPGLCNARKTSCPGGTNLCIAVPADPSDPLQTNWTKDEYARNPIVNGTQRDPSTAWQNPSGEWQLTTFDTIIYGSMDFKEWYKIGAQPGFVHGECPSFFPLPRTTPFAGPAPKGAETPSHVHLSTHGVGNDLMVVGTYVPGERGKVGTFNQTPGVPFTGTKIDTGITKATKDFYDPVKKRRIHWSSVHVGDYSSPARDFSGFVQSMPREVTWNPELQQTVHSPIEEQASLREKVIGSLKSQILYAGKILSLDLPEKLGNQSEIRISFARPSVPTTLSVRVMANLTSSSPAHAREMPRSPVKSTLTGGTDFSIDYSPHEDGKISTVVVRAGSFTHSLKLSPNDYTIEMALYVDNTFTEAYFMDGRAVMTVPTAATNDAAVGVSSSVDGVYLNSATVWHVSPIWITPEDVKSAPRLDGKLRPIMPVWV